MNVHVQSHPELLPDIVKILSTALITAQDKTRELEKKLESETCAAKAENKTLRELYELERDTGRELRAALEERCRRETAVDHSREKVPTGNEEPLETEKVRLETELESLKLANQSRLRYKDAQLSQLRAELTVLHDENAQLRTEKRRLDVLAIVLKKVLDAPVQTVTVERTMSEDVETSEPLVFHIERSPGQEHRKEREPLVQYIQRLPKPPPSCRPFFDEYHVRETHLQPVARAETLWDAEFKPEFQTTRAILHFPKRTVWYCRSRIHVAVFTPTHVYSRPEERWIDNNGSLDAYSANGQQVEFFANKGSFVYYFGTYLVHNLPPVQAPGWDIPADVPMYVMYRHTGLAVNEREMLKECYADGYIRTKCFVLQCVGFNYELYTALRERFPHVHVFGQADSLPTSMIRKAEVELGELVEPSKASKRRKRKKNGN